MTLICLTAIIFTTVISIVIFKQFKKLVDKECPIDNCPDCGRITYSKCKCSNQLRISHSVEVNKIDMNEWLSQYNHPLVRYFN